MCDGSSDTDKDLYGFEDEHQYRICPGKYLYSPYSKKTTQIVFDTQSGKQVARLKEPRDLYGVSSNSFHQLPRWPYECEVLKEKVQHLDWSPPTPEPMYKATGQEQEPPCVEPTVGKVVYLANEGNKEPCYMYSKAGGNRPLRDVTPESCRDLGDTLAFEARFESGNLQKVVQIGEHDYQLTLRTDLYTERHTQWFYFRVRNTRANVLYRFTIVNFRKPNSLYNQGMRPLVYSEIEAKTHRVGWHRVGEEIKYYKNNLSQYGNPCYSLSWTFKLPHSMDTCYFAYSYPYTYSNLQDYLAGIATDPKKSKCCKIRLLCQSLAGNMVYVLTITNPNATTIERKKKKAVIVTARVHPGETNSSWVMKGFLDFILSPHKDACRLRDAFVFKVVPMLNPDGVIVGNHRCSLAGRDLNRNYKCKLKDIFPSIWFTRYMIQRVMEEREVLLYCDLHGHSRKQNAFMYGCSAKRGQSAGGNLAERIFPLMLAKNCPEKFSFSDCKFKVQKSKEGTGRVVVWRMGVKNSYTLESTFCGSTLGKRRGTHFSTQDLESVGHHFCTTLLDYCDPKKRTELEEMLKQRKRRHSSSSPLNSFIDVLSDQDESTDGSDSSDSDGPPAHLMGLADKVMPKKKVLKSIKERNASKDAKQRLKDEDETTVGRKLFMTVDGGLSAVTKPTGTPEKTDSKQKMAQRSTFPKLQGGQSHQDPSRKKVSVVHLVFNSKGDVITTKEPPDHANKKGVMSVNGFKWDIPAPLFKSFLFQRLPVIGVFQHCGYCDVRVGHSDSNACREYRSAEDGPSTRDPGHFKMPFPKW
ncbi:cytosolic carboxypeptidase 3 [Spea bombifrons]|uniref:cytosolic carboxypeptidase 3 n=1 Tax=Spea bombifrons TaxID=233779 RepID=UPI0023492B86|nr:cytosolic carboxypeptidase 3 [Spea bombifrons]